MNLDAEHKKLAPGLMGTFRNIGFRLISQLRKSGLFHSSSLCFGGWSPLTYVFPGRTLLRAGPSFACIIPKPWLPHPLRFSKGGLPDGLRLRSFSSPASSSPLRAVRSPRPGRARREHTTDSRSKPTDRVRAPSHASRGWDACISASQLSFLPKRLRSRRSMKVMATYIHKSATSRPLRASKYFAQPSGVELGCLFIMSPEDSPAVVRVA